MGKSTADMDMEDKLGRRPKTQLEQDWPPFVRGVGHTLGALTRKDIRQKLYSLGVSNHEIENAVTYLAKVSKAFYR